jgi:hypothetical protein
VEAANNSAHKLTKLSFGFAAPPPLSGFQVIFVAGGLFGGPTKLLLDRGRRPMGRA